MVLVPLAVLVLEREPPLRVTILGGSMTETVSGAVAKFASLADPSSDWSAIERPGPFGRQSGPFPLP